MHNLNVGSQLTPAQEHANWTIVEQACSRDIYSYWLNAEMLSDGGHAAAATYTAATLTMPSYWLCADAVVSGVTAYVRRHEEWKAGSFKIKLHWTSDVAGDSVRIGTGVVPVTPAAAYPSLQLYANLPNGPSVANYVLVNEFNTDGLSQMSAIDLSHCGVRVDIRRGTAGDTNTGNVKIFGVELIYFETKRVVGEGFLR